MNEARIKELESKIDGIDSNVRRLHNAILGDAEAGSIGMVSRLINMEMNKKDLERRIEALEDAKKQVYAYAAALSFFISAVMGVVFTVIKFVMK